MYFLDGDMAPLFEQASTLGRVEHQLTRFSCGQWRPQPLSPELGTLSGEINGFGWNKKMPISVFVEIILIPENLALERLTPVIFKKARIGIELRKSLKALDDARRLLPYNFELALVLVEIRLVTELLVLACSAVKKSLPQKHSSSLRRITYSPGRVGVGHLPLTVRTDLANILLEIGAQFQHVWLSRSIASTLPNALQIYDNLFRALLPPEMQEMGHQLL